MGEVIVFRDRQKEPSLHENNYELSNQRSCFECQHALFGVHGTWCRLYAIDVWDEQKEAEGCEDFDP